MYYPRYTLSLPLGHPLVRDSPQLRSVHAPESTAAAPGPVNESFFRYSQLLFFTPSVRRNNSSYNQDYLRVYVLAMINMHNYNHNITNLRDFTSAKIFH